MLLHSLSAKDRLWFANDCFFFKEVSTKHRHSPETKGCRIRKLRNGSGNSIDVFSNLQVTEESGNKSVSLLLIEQVTRE